MIIDDRKHICIITPPKCCSTSFHYAMCPPAFRCDGPQFDGYSGKHTHVLPRYVAEAIEDWTIFFLVRHPYVRLLSLYGHWKQYWDEPKTEGSLREFINTIVIPQHAQFLCAPLSNVVSAFWQLYPDVQWRTLQFEKWDTILPKFGLDLDVPRTNTSDHGTCEEEYTTDLLEFTKHWARYDFDLFGYSREPWWDVKEPECRII